MCIFLTFGILKRKVVLGISAFHLQKEWQFFMIFHPKLKRTDTCPYDGSCDMQSQNIFWLIGGDDSIPLSLDFFFFLSLFIYFVRKRESVSGEGAEREERARIPSRLHTASTEPDVGLDLTNRKIVT